MGLFDRLLGKSNQTEIPIRKLSGHTKNALSCCFSPDSRYIVSGSVDRTIKIWDIEQGGVLLKTLTGHTDMIHYCCFSPDGNTIASVSNDKSLLLWDFPSGTIQKKIMGHTDGVTFCCFSPDGKRIASASYDKTVRIWDLDGNLLKTIEHPQGWWCKSCGFSPDGKKLVTSDKWFGYIWDTETWNKLETFRPESMQFCRYSNNGSLIGVASDRDDHLSIWDAGSAKKIVTLRNHSGKNLISGTTCCDFSPNDKYIIAPEGSVIELWDINTWTKIMTYDTRIWLPVNFCCFSPDGRFIASASADSSIILWFLEDIIRDVIRKYP